jgi:hypothetical protein
MAASGGAAMVLAVRLAKVYAHAKGDPFGATTRTFWPLPGPLGSLRSIQNFFRESSPLVL